MGSQSFTAADILNKLKEDDLAMIIKELGEERHSKLVARKICEYRKNTKIESTYQLNEIIENTIQVIATFGNEYKKHLERFANVLGTLKTPLARINRPRNRKFTEFCSNGRLLAEAPVNNSGNHSNMLRWIEMFCDGRSKCNATVD